MPLETTVIGSFPKPDFLQIPDWFKTGTAGSASSATRAYTEMITKQSTEDAERLERDLIRATGEVMDIQRQCGIDVVTDGEIRRENYIHHLCRFIEGVDFENLTRKSVRNGAYITELPTIRGRVSWRGPLDVTEEWRKANAVGDGSMVKYTLPGPMTIMGTVHDAFYHDEQALAKDLAVILNTQVRALVAAGCRHIQIDEPMFARQPLKALDWGIAMLEACYEGVNASDCERQMHMCCGYPDHLDQEGYLKADPQAYFMLAPALDASCIDAVSIEDAHCHNDLSLLGHFTRTKVIFGTVTVASSQVESVEDIELRLNDALQYIDADRLVVAPDCGLALLPPGILKQKLNNMCLAAKRCGCKRARLASK
jgi:5-methyltetrahydropteroyltriglutamate--homocysteine methyltransferase